MTSVLLASVPFAPLGSPSLGLSLLQACLREHGIASRVRHFGLDFAARIGVSEYRLVADELLFTPDLTGDWIFAEALRGTPVGLDAWFSQVLGGGHPAHRKPLRLAVRNFDEVCRRLRDIQKAAGPFLDRCAGEIVAAAPRVLGLTSVFAQNAAALALARRVKALAPEMLVCLGGANAEGPMGEALFEHYPFLDVVVSGEGEHRFLPIVEARLAGHGLPPLEGAWIRANLLADAPRLSPGPVNLERLPAPDYSEFFDQLGESGLRLKVELPFETSRGCWWGQKHHCTFCGLNGATMQFRGKPAEKALNELRALRTRWPGREISVVDNILDMGYFRDFLPALASERDPPALFFEVKANLTRAQLELLRAAGVRRIQPGIESLSDDVLRRMKKGLKAMQGIQLLREGARLGMDVAWNLLAGFPGEDPQEYARMADLVPLLTHLQAPALCSAIRLDRFSPLHADTALDDVHAFPAYAHVYDLPQEALDRLAYYFTFRYADGRDVAGYLAPLEEQIERWTARPASLTANDSRVEDTRECATAAVHHLTEMEGALLRACDEPTTTDRLGPLAAALPSLRGKKLLLTQGERHLSLPIFESSLS
ncbi:MAG: RiPP maturation radical SAM protein 1 [Armatimonadetes bacterium]|nr:RiPP maturation radical SAM protein 1 [Armatimonadota bacterium]